MMQRGYAALRRLHTDPLLRGSAYLMSATAAGSLLGFVFWLVAARTTDPASIGIAATALSTISLVALLAASGIGPALLLAIPQSGARWWRTALEGAIGVGLVSFAVSMLGLWGWGRLGLDTAGVSSNTGLMLLISMGAALAAMIVAFDATAIATRNGALVVVRTTLVAMIKLVLLLLVGWPALGMVGAGAVGVIASTILATLLGLVVAVLVLARRRARISQLVGSATHAVALRPWRAVHWDHLAAVAGQLPAFVVPLIITARLGVAESGFYYIAWSVAASFFVISPAICQALLAEGSHAPQDVLRQIRRAVRFTLALLVPMMLLVAVASRPVLEVFGSAYAAGAWLILLCFVAAALPDAATNTAVASLRLVGRRAQAALVNLVAMLITLAGALVLAERGLVWVGMAWIAGQLVGVLVAWGVWHYRREEVTVR